MLLALLGALLLDEASEEARLGTLRELRNRTGTSGLVTRRRRDGVLDALLSLEGQYGLPVMAQTAYVLLIEVPPFETPSFYRDRLGYKRHVDLQDLAGLTDFREWPALARRIFRGVNDPWIERLIPWIAKQIDRANETTEEDLKQWRWGSAPAYWVQRLVDVLEAEQGGEVGRGTDIDDRLHEAGHVLPSEADCVDDMSSINLDAIMDTPLSEVLAWLDHDELLGLRDWLEATGEELETLTAEGAMLLQRQWHEQLSKGRFYQQPIPTAVVIMRWPDGATLQRLCTDADFRAEGESMGHCIGGQINRRTGRASGKSYYYQRSEQGQEASFSYRDPAGVPQATFTIQYTGNEDLPWSLEQIQGPSDDKVTDEDAAARVASVLEALYESTAGVDGMYVDDMLEMAGRKLLWAYEPAIRGLMRLSSVRDSIEARNNSKGDLIEIIGAWTSSDEVAGDLEHRPLAHQSVSDAVSALSHLDFQIKTKLHEIVPPIFGERMLRHEENGEPVIWTDVESYPYETTQQTPGWLRDILPTYTTTGIGWTVTGSDGRQYDLEASISSELRWVLSDRETGTVVRSANSFSTILDQLGIPGSYAEALSDLAERADRAIMPFEDDSLLTTTEEFREARDRRFIEGAP